MAQSGHTGLNTHKQFSSPTHIIHIFLDICNGTRYRSLPRSLTQTPARTHSLIFSLSLTSYSLSIFGVSIQPTASVHCLKSHFLVVWGKVTEQTKNCHKNMTARRHHRRRRHLFDGFTITKKFIAPNVFFFSENLTWGEQLLQWLG